MDSKRTKRSNPDSVTPNCREKFHRHLVAAIVQEVDWVVLVGEVAKRIVPQVTGALAVDELASQLVSKYRGHLTTTLAKALIIELMGDVAATDTASTEFSFHLARLSFSRHLNTPRGIAFLLRQCGQDPQAGSFVICRRFGFGKNTR